MTHINLEHIIRLIQKCIKIQLHSHNKHSLWELMGGTQNIVCCLFTLFALLASGKDIISGKKKKKKSHYILENSSTLEKVCLTSICFALGGLD